MHQHDSYRRFGSPDRIHTAFTFLAITSVRPLPIGFRCCDQHGSPGGEDESNGGRHLYGIHAVEMSLGGNLGLRYQDSRLAGLASRLDCSIGVKFLEDPPDMGSDGVVGHTQTMGDLLVAASLSQ
jgi:hypothetical protein